MQVLVCLLAAMYFPDTLISFAILLIGIKCTSYGSQFFNISLFSFIINLVYCLVQILIFCFIFLIFYCLVQTFGSYA